MCFPFRISHADVAQLTNDDTIKPIPPNTYDVGDGYFSPLTGKIYTYEVS